MARKTYGAPDGIPEGSNFTIEAILETNGIQDSVAHTSSATLTLSVSDSVLNATVPLLSAEATDSYLGASAVVKWEITSSQSSGWEAGTYLGDIRATTSSGGGNTVVTYFPIAMQIRAATDTGI